MYPNEMVLGVEEPVLDWLSLGALLVAFAVSGAVLVRFSDDRQLFAPLRERLVLGVPWGTLAVVVVVYGIYFVLQGGNEPGGPNVVGYRSWSLWYPQGLVLSSFAHASKSHLFGNLLGTLAFAPIVEYAWSHYPTKRGSQSFSSLRTNPFARIGAFVVGVFVAGLVDSLFVPGAVIGFSGVVFMFAGFALVARPLATVLAILGLRVLGLVRRAVVDPVSVAVAEPSFVTPGWALTALQGHVFGMLVGVLLGVALVRRREERPDLRYLWFGALVFAVTRSMYALYWFEGENRFVLLRGLGTAGVFLLASLVALAALSSERRVIPRVGLPARTTAVSLLFVVALLIGLAGVPYNLVPATPDDATSDGIEVDGYTVTYAEDVTDEYTAIDLPFVKDALTIEVSGVIITSEQRSIWSLDTPKQELRFDGRAVVVVGDLTWRELVVIDRTEWQMTGGNTTYKVSGAQWNTDQEKLLYTADNATASPTINGSRITVGPTQESYELVVERNGSILGREPVPANNESVAIGGITLERVENDLFAVHERTRVKIGTFNAEGRRPN